MSLKAWEAFRRWYRSKIAVVSLDSAKEAAMENMDRRVQESISDVQKASEELRQLSSEGADRASRARDLIAGVIREIEDSRTEKRQ